MKPGQERKKSFGKGGYKGGFVGKATERGTPGDSGSAARFFKACPFDDEDPPVLVYCGKAISERERGRGNLHKTVKPLSLMRYLVGLVTRPGATVLDCFMGSGQTIRACVQTGRIGIGIEREAEWFELARRLVSETPPFQGGMELG